MGLPEGGGGCREVGGGPAGGGGPGISIVLYKTCSIGESKKQCQKMLCTVPPVRGEAEGGAAEGGGGLWEV